MLCTYLWPDIASGRNFRILACFLMNAHCLCFIDFLLTALKSTYRTVWIPTSNLIISILTIKIAQCLVDWGWVFCFFLLSCFWLLLGFFLTVMLWIITKQKTRKMLLREWKPAVILIPNHIPLPSSPHPSHGLHIMTGKGQHRLLSLMTRSKNQCRPRETLLLLLMKSGHSCHASPLTLIFMPCDLELFDLSPWFLGGMRPPVMDLSSFLVWASTGMFC